MHVLQNSNRTSAYITSEWIRVYFTTAHTLQVKEHKPQIFFFKVIILTSLPQSSQPGRNKKGPTALYQYDEAMEYDVWKGLNCGVTLRKHPPTCTDGIDYCHIVIIAMPLPLAFVRIKLHLNISVNIVEILHLCRTTLVWKYMKPM